MEENESKPAPNLGKAGVMSWPGGLAVALAGPLVAAATIAWPAGVLRVLGVGALGTGAMLVALTMGLRWDVLVPDDAARRQRYRERLSDAVRTWLAVGVASTFAAELLGRLP